MSFQDLQNGAKSPPSSSSNNSSSQAVAAGIFQINTAVSAFRRLVDSTGTVKDTPDHRQKLSNTRQLILELVKQTSDKLKSLSESDCDAGVNASKKIEDAKLAKDFHAVLQEFKKVQQLASQRESTYFPSSVQQTSASDDLPLSSTSQEALPFLAEHKRQEIVMLDNEISFNEAMIEERDQGLREIDVQIGEANEIFKDLAVLVHEQGAVIDDIQWHVDNTSALTTHAKVQLSRGSKTVKSRSSWCWWVLVVLVLVLVVLLIILII